MQSVNCSRQVSQLFSQNFAVKEHKATLQPTVSQHSVSLFAKTNQPTTDQLSKEGSPQLHTGESKRPAVEQMPNSWDTEPTIDNILIEMAQEARMCRCLELNN